MATQGIYYTPYQQTQQPYYIDKTRLENPINPNNTQVTFGNNPNLAPSEVKKDPVEDGKDDGSVGFLGALKNIGKGVLNFGKSLIGFDANGNWSLGSFLKNAAIAVGVGALCVLTAGTAVPALIAAGGVVLAGGSLAKGVYNVATAETDAEAEAAWQQVGSGVAATALAVTGAKAVAKGMHPEIKGSYNAVKTVFKDSGAAIKSTGSDLISASKGASGFRGKFDAVKGEVTDQWGEFSSTVSKNYNKIVYGSKGKVSNEAEQVGKELEEVRAEQAKITDHTSKQYQALEAKAAKLEAKQSGLQEINRQTSYDEASRIVEQTKADLKAKETELATAEGADKAKIQAEVDVLKSRAEAQQSALSRRTSEAQALRDKIDANNRKIESIRKSNNPDTAKIAELEAENRALAARQDFTIPTRESAQAARTAQNEARIAARKAERKFNETPYENRTLYENAMEEMIETQTAYRTAQAEAARIGGFDGKYGYYKNTASEVGRAIYNDPGAKWMTIYTAGKDHPVSSEARFLSFLTSEQKAAYKQMTTQQKEALLQQYGFAA